MNPILIDYLIPFLRGKKILLGITGSIAAYKTPELVRGLKKCGAEVRVILTEAGEKFVAPLSLETVSENPVAQSMWGTGQGTHHITQARWADLLVVAPATAHCIAKFAHGFADDLLSTEFLAFQGPVLIAPAMNPAMFLNLATQENIEQLRKRGIKISGPEVGATACQEEGLGRMIDLELLLQDIALCFCEKKKNKKVLITLGPTQSHLDPVRYLTNRSSGKMGASLAWAACREGYEVEVLSGLESICVPHVAKFSIAKTTDTMLTQALNSWPNCDLLFATAAVLDWQVKKPSPEKIKKSKGEGLSLEWIQSPDVLAQLAAVRQPRQYVVGFAAESEDVLGYAKLKRVEKKCNAIFANSIVEAGSGFEQDTNAGWWITPQAEIKVTTRKKRDLAYDIIQWVQEEWN